MLKKASSDRVLKAISGAIDNVNQLLDKEEKIEKAPDTALFGPSGVLDSLGFVNLIVAVEQKIEEEFGVAITLADERAMSRRNNPFQTIRTLSDYITSLLEEKTQKP